MMSDGQGWAATEGCSATARGLAVLTLLRENTIAIWDNAGDNRACVLG
jgi:hypothetical protein